MFDVIVIGGTNVDIKAKTAHSQVPGTSNPGSVSFTPGGVARNIAHNLGLLRIRVALVTVIGKDAAGELANAATAAAGVDMTLALHSNQATGSYVAVLDHMGELVTAVSDMQCLESLTPDHVKQHAEVLEPARYIVADCNLREDVLQYLAQRFGEKLIMEPVSVAKSAKLKLLLEKHEIFLATPNHDQLAMLMEGGVDLHEHGLQNLVIHMGALGAVVSSASGATQIPSLVRDDVQDVTGAGDAAVAGLVYGLVKGYDIKTAAHYGQAAASLKLATASSTAKGLTETALQAILKERG